MTKIHGYITDKNGDPLINANVYFSDENGNYHAGSMGTITDATGEYFINGVGDYLTASYTGYKRKVEPVNGRNKINFVLTDNTTLPAVEIKGIQVSKYIFFILLIVVLIVIIYKYHGVIF